MVVAGDELPGYGGGSQPGPENMIKPRSIVFFLAVLSGSAVQAIAAPQAAAAGSTRQDKKLTGEKPKGTKKVDERAALAKTIRAMEQQVRVGKLQAKLDRMRDTSKRTAATVALTKAARLAKAAADALANFQAYEAPTALETAKISLKSAQDSATHAEDEFKELVAMYKADEFAEMTKELVLKRGRSRMVLANRRLAVQESRLANLKNFIHVAKLRDLRGKARDATAAEDAAQRAQSEADLEIKISGMKAAGKAAELLLDLAAAKKKQGKR